MPNGKGRKVRALESTFFNATYFGSTTPDDWKAYRFFTQEADTVTAIRKGIVVNVSDLYDGDNSISLIVTYLKSAEIAAAKKNLKETKSLYGFITPYFCTLENVNGILTSQQYYTSTITTEIIQKEMSKKEIKGLTKK